MDKNALRKHMGERRNDLHKTSNFNILCLILQNHIVKHPLFLSAKNICTYAPAKSEIDVNPISQTAWKQNKTVYYPRCSKTQKGIMHFYLCNNFSELEKGAYGILEPKKACPICSEETLNSPDTLILVPALSYSPRGYRLGYGQGFYDRFLAKIPLAGSFGITFTALISEEIPAAPWDLPVQYLVTEEGIQKTRS